jgi:hypothetical protein
MNSIYGHFLLAIIEIAGLDANKGLPGVRPNTRPLRYIPVGEMHEFVASTDRLGTIMETISLRTKKVDISGATIIAQLFLRFGLAGLLLLPHQDLLRGCSVRQAVRWRP